MNKENIGTALITLGLLALILFIMWWAGEQLLAGLIDLAGAIGEETQASSQCLELGYPGYKIEFGGIKYCMKSVNGTDVVVPLKELLGG